MDIRYVNPLTGEAGHFVDREFVGRCGYGHTPFITLVALELMRVDISAELGAECSVHINGIYGNMRAVRSMADLNYLAVTKGLGWTHNGGKVSIDSQHLLTNGANAVDVTVRCRGEIVDPLLWAPIAGKHFDYVKKGALYCHCDQNKGGLLLPEAYRA